jgi:histidinol-phosphatase
MKIGKQIKSYLDFSIKTVTDSSRITLKYFNKNIKSRLKENKTPVTVADIECENFIIDKIKKTYPSHDIYSEENGEFISGSEFIWFIDPIDGTKNYIRKIPFWGTLLALGYRGEIISGVIYMPVLDEMIYASKNGGCFSNGKRVHVSKVDSIKDSYLLHGGYKYIFNSRYKKTIPGIVNSSFHNRGFGDCHGHSLVIKGMADAMIDPTPAPYDLAATKICIEEAGGKLTDLEGADTIHGGTALI